MAATKVGRSKVVSGSAAPATASAYGALDAIGAPFVIPGAAPNRGALLVDTFILESGSASAQIRLHFYTHLPSAAGDGNTATLQPGSGYLGYIDVSNYVSAHGSAALGRNVTDNLALHGDADGAVYCQMQAVGAPTFNAATSQMLLFLGLLQD